MHRRAFEAQLRKSQKGYRSSSNQAAAVRAAQWRDCVKAIAWRKTDLASQTFILTPADCIANIVARLLALTSSSASRLRLQSIKQRAIFVLQIQGMRIHRLQLVGPLALFAAVLAAEAAAYALAIAPSSAFLWYLNLEVFSLFRKSRILLSEFCNMPFAQILVMAGPMALVGMLGLLLRNNLFIAISSNLGFMLAAFVAYSWNVWNSYGHVTASLVSVHIPSGSAFYLLVVLALASFGSFLLSHATYFAAIRARR